MRSRVTDGHTNRKTHRQAQNRKVIIEPAGALQALAGNIV